MRERARNAIRVTFGRRRTFVAPQRIVQRLGAYYDVGGERYYPHHFTPRGLVLHHASRPTSAVCEESTGPCEPHRWRE